MKNASLIANGIGSIIKGFIFLMAIHSCAQAQDMKSLQLMASDGIKPILSFPHRLTLPNESDCQVVTLRFYLHNVELKHEGRLVWASAESHYLFDSGVASRLEIPLSISASTPVDEISFVIGVDSALQVNGAHSGVLDPIQGMYWTWQSGYIHWKLETEFLDSASDSSLTWHVGGYRAPYNSMRVIRYAVNTDSTSYLFTVDIRRLINDVWGHVPLMVMSPSAHAMKLADSFQSCIQWQP
jgi:hypothetical protein